MNSENGNTSNVAKEQAEEKSKTPMEPVKASPLPVSSISGFNTEEFLARVNMNEKINYLLRSPTKTANGSRQRSVFTAITPVSKRQNFFVGTYQGPLKKVMPRSCCFSWGARMSIFIIKKFEYYRVFSKFCCQ